MLFNSTVFLLLFLPLTLVVYLRLSNAWIALGWLSLTSLVFYGYWNPAYLVLILCSVAVNFSLGRLILRSPEARSWWVAAAGVTFNLALLGYYKYANFFVAEVASLTGTAWSIDTIILPLAISFFTFQQIAYLVDAHRGNVSPHGIVEYAAFVTFFPQLIAGPIVHHRDMLPQFRSILALREKAGNVGIGLTIFAIGLFKKVAIADELAVFANPVFDAALAGEPLSIAEAWGGTLAYTFQLYFDFSGYADMAIGLGRMFGLTLPVNFASPYKAHSIIDFWRAWHITLSNFLRVYLYIPLGGNRSGPVARHRNLLITMLLGGLWHGAGWTFVIWGGLHGFYLVVNHLWRQLPFHPRLESYTLYSAAAWVLTMLCVMVGWVFFRAESLDAALTILATMGGINGFDLPRALGSVLQPVLGSAVRFGGFFPNIGEQWKLGIALIVMSAAIARFAPNAHDMFSHTHARGINDHVPLRKTRLTWEPNTGWAIGAGILLAFCLLSVNEPSEFLYFQF